MLYNIEIGADLHEVIHCEFFGVKLSLTLRHTQRQVIIIIFFHHHFILFFSLHLQYRNLCDTVVSNEKGAVKDVKSSGQTTPRFIK